MTKKLVLFMGAAVSLYAQNTVNNAYASGQLGVGGGNGSANLFTSFHAGFTAYTNPEPSITGSVSYTDYSGQANTGPYQGPGIASFTEPVSIDRAFITITSAFQANGGAPAITAVQLSMGTLTNPTAYMLPVQVTYPLSAVSCSSGVCTFTLSAPVLPANETGTVVVSGASGTSCNGTLTATWTSSTTFTASSGCTSYTSGGMAGLQGLISPGVAFTAAPQAQSGSDTAYLWLTEVNTNPANLTNLTAGMVKVQLGGVQLQ